MSVCVCVIKRGHYLTNDTSLLPFIFATQETRINTKSVFGAFIYLFSYLFLFIKDFLSQQFSSFSHGEIVGISQLKMSDRITGGFTCSIVVVSHVLFFIFGNYYRNTLKQFDLFVHLIAQWGCNRGITHYQ